MINLEEAYHIKTGQRKTFDPIISDANSLHATPAHDAYQIHGTLVGLTVGTYNISYADLYVNILEVR